MDSNNPLTFAEPVVPEQEYPPLRPWKIMIVDDDETVHTISELVLGDFRFESRSLKFIHAYSAAEAMDMLRRDDEVAVALVDVVMETDHAGLDLVRAIRDDLENHKIRLVLRTGQPGMAPEEEIIEQYDINDYKDKTELTAIKLKTVLYATLRGYRDLSRLEDNRKGLEVIVESSARMFDVNSLQQFTRAVLLQMTTLLGINRDAAYLQRTSSFVTSNQKGEFTIVAATGCYEGWINDVASERLSPETWQQISEAVLKRETLIFDSGVVFYYCTSLGVENLLYLALDEPLSEDSKKLLDVFSSNVAVAFENAYIKHELEGSQQEVMALLGEAIEKRHCEPGMHVKRVAEISRVLAQKLDFSQDECELILSASPLHDIGKITIPEAVLNKPEKLDEQEWQLVRKHAEAGHAMLSRSRHRVLQYAAIIAHEHHENWDGSGYPRGLKGQQIHVLGRITAAADVFDVLNSDTCYRAAWSLSEIKDYFARQRGRKFEPALVDLVFANLPEILEICRRYRDAEG